MNFIPHNDLEQDLMAVHEGKAEADVFVLRLLDQQVFMPVLDEKDAIAGFQRSTQAQPLIVTDEDGERVLVLFTSPERAKAMVADFPDYSGGLLTEFSWLLRRMDGGFHIALNPGWDIGMDFDADTVAQLIAQLPPEDAA
ncbi:MAG: SseB family protein [Thiobacillaceae bacterium]